MLRFIVFSLAVCEEGGRVFAEHGLPILAAIVPLNREIVVRAYKALALVVRFFKTEQVCSHNSEF